MIDESKIIDFKRKIRDLKKAITVYSKNNSTKGHDCMKMTDKEVKLKEGVQHGDCNVDKDKERDDSNLARIQIELQSLKLIIENSFLPKNEEQRGNLLLFRLYMNQLQKIQKICVILSIESLETCRTLYLFLESRVIETWINTKKKGRNMYVCAHVCVRLFCCRLFQFISPRSKVTFGLNLIGYHLQSDLSLKGQTSTSYHGPQIKKSYGKIF